MDLKFQKHGHPSGKSCHGWKNVYNYIIVAKERNIVLHTIFDEAAQNQVDISGSNGKYMNLF